MTVLKAVLGTAAVVGLGMAAGFVWSVIKAVRRTGRRARREGRPVRELGPAVDGLE